MDILQEMIKETETLNRKKVFSTYKPKSEIGQMIFDTIISKKYSRRQNNKGFFMAENEKNKIGIISHCLGLETIAMSKYFDIEVLINEKNGNDYKQIIFDTLQSIFSLLGINNEKVDTILRGMPENVTFNYDASPYIFNDDMDDETLSLTSYVDTIAKVLETFIEFRAFYNKYLDNGYKIELENISDLSKYIDAIIIKSMNDLNDSCIKCEKPIEYRINGQILKDKYNEDCLYKGWNYLKMDSTAEPSLYFTYVACSAYATFFGAFSNVISAIRNLEKKMTVEERLLKICPKLQNIKNASFERDVRFFEIIYKEYVDFNKCCVDSGHYMDIQLVNSKIDITQNFVGQGYNEVTTTEILNSTTNDALINNIFIILVSIYSGLDLDYATYGVGDDFNDRLQYAVQNILKVYKTLERTNKNYIVDQYFLSFNEKIPTIYNEQTKILRKQRILVASLMPLLIKAYTAMSKYVINYPQKQMKDYLRIILENRTFDRHNNTQLWIWDKEGYNISINLLYILNLMDFYSYYETYELPYTNDEETFVYQLEKREKEYQKELETINNEHNEEVRELKDKLNKTLEKINELKPIEKEVITVSMDYLKDNIQSIIASALNQAREDTINNSVPNELTRAFKGIFEAMFAVQIKKQIDVGKISQQQKLSENPTFLRYEESLFNRFRDWLIDEMRKEEGLK